MIRAIQKTYKNAYSGLPRRAWFLAAILLINRSGSMVLFFMMLYLTQKLNFTTAQAGAMMSIYGFGGLLGAYFGGKLTDQIGSYRVQFFSLFVSGFIYVLLSFMTSALSISITMFFLALIGESYRPANNAAFSKACPEHLRTRGFGLLRMALNLGITIGPVLGGFLAMKNYALLFWIDGFTCSAAGIFLYLFSKNEFRNERIKRLEKQEKTHSVWRDKTYLFFSFLMLVVGIVLMQVMNMWPVELKLNIGLDENMIGVLLAINTIIIVLFEMPLIHLLEKKSTLRVMAVGAFLLCLGFALMPLNHTFAFIVFTIIIWTIGEMLIFPLAGGWIANRANDNNRGEYMGLFSVAFSLAHISAPIFGSQIYEHFGSRTLWTTIGMLGIFLFIAFYSLDKKQKKSRPFNGRDF